jgi:hypothetical protein
LNPTHPWDAPEPIPTCPAAALDGARPDRPFRVRSGRTLYRLDILFVTLRRLVGLDVDSPKRNSGTTDTSPLVVSYSAATDVVLPRHRVIGRKRERLPGSLERGDN